MAPMAAVSWEYMRARLKRGSAIVMMIRMIAITIRSSIREKPRRRRCRFIIRILTYLMTHNTAAAWRGIGGPAILRAEKRGFHETFPAYGRDRAMRPDRPRPDLARPGGRREPPPPPPPPCPPPPTTRHPPFPRRLPH